MKTYNSLRARLRAFVRAYVESGIGVKAMHAIKFTGRQPRIAASKLLAKPRIRQAIEEFELSMQDVVRQRVYANLRRLDLIAGWDPITVMDEKGNYLPLDQWPEEARIALQGIEIEELFEGRGKDREHVGRLHKYKLASKIEAAKLIMQYQRVLVEKHEVETGLVVRIVDPTRQNDATD